MIEKYLSIFSKKDKPNFSMLNIFRNIRRKLATENKFVQYSRYAIGEIVLVMIGILLALQVNNWNEERKQTRALTGALENLVKDLAIQQELVEEQLDYETQKIDEVKELIPFIGNPVASEVARLIDSLSARHTFVMMQSSLKNLEDSGGLIQIKDLELQNGIVRYFQLLDYTTSVTNNNNLYLIDNQYGRFALQNPFHLEIDEGGNPSLGRSLTAEEKYMVLSNLKLRLKASESIEERILILGKETKKLIQQVNLYLE